MFEHHRTHLYRLDIADDVIDGVSVPLPNAASLSCSGPPAAIHHSLRAEHRHRAPAPSVFMRVSGRLGTSRGHYWNCNTKSSCPFCSKVEVCNDGAAACTSNANVGYGYTSTAGGAGLLVVWNAFFYAKKDASPM